MCTLKTARVWAQVVGAVRVFRLDGVMNGVAGCGGRAVGNEGVEWCKQRADLDPDRMRTGVGFGVAWRGVA